MKNEGNVYDFIDLNRNYGEAKWFKPEGRYELEHVKKFKFLVAILNMAENLALKTKGSFEQQIIFFRNKQILIKQEKSIRCNEKKAEFFCNITDPVQKSIPKKFRKYIDETWGRDITLFVLFICSFTTAYEDYACYLKT